jgi:hypothetical protein
MARERLKAFRLYGSISKHHLVTPTVATVPAPAMTDKASTSHGNKSNRLVSNFLIPHEQTPNF